MRLGIRSQGINLDDRVPTLTHLALEKEIAHKARISRESRSSNAAIGGFIGAITAWLLIEIIPPEVPPEFWLPSMVVGGVCCAVGLHQKELWGTNRRIRHLSRRVSQLGRLNQVDLPTKRKR